MIIMRVGKIYRFSPGVDRDKIKEYDTFLEVVTDSKGNEKVVERKLKVRTNQFINLYI